MATSLVLAFIALFLAAGPANAQFGLGSLFAGPPLPPPPPGAGKSIADVICGSQDTTTFCQLIRLAQTNPTVSELLDPTFTGTVFLPTNVAFEDSQRRLTSLGVRSVADLQQNPAQAARIIASHVIVGKAVNYAQLKNGDKYRNALGDVLTIQSGLLGGLYVKGPTNTVKIQSGAGQNDIPAARAYLQKVDGVIIPKKQ